MVIELEIEVLQGLIPFYDRYAEGEDWVSLRETARELYLKYNTADVLLSDVVNRAIGPLLHFFAPSGRPLISRERARIIAEALKKRQAELNAQSAHSEEK